MGISYLVKPAEYLEESIYKIGRSNNDDISRIKSYGKNTKVYCIIKVADNIYVEKLLINYFTANFQLHKGREYFKGDIDEMYKSFINIVCNNINVKHEDIKDDVIKHDVIKDNVIKMFPTANEDINYGGDKFLVKIKILSKHKLAFYYIYEDNIVEEIYDELNVDFIHTYWKKLLDKRIIENNKIVNLYDKKLLSKIDAQKYKVNAVITPYTKNLLNDYDKNNCNISKYKFMQLHLFNEIIINSKYHCSLNYYDKNKYIVCELSQSMNNECINLKYIKEENIFYDENITTMLKKVKNIQRRYFCKKDKIEKVYYLHNKYKLALLFH